ncbi:MAG: DMT family transporter [Clostridiaceae bacterium]|nr:DMT family transporter [Clostridiaceae bacterium]
MEVSKKQQKLYIGILAAIFCTMLWGSASPFIKLGYDFFEMDTSNVYNILLFAGVRFFGSGWLTLGLSWILTKQRPHFSRSLIKPTILMALSQTVLQYFLFYMGLTVVTGASGALLSSTNAFFAVILAAVVGVERLTVKKLVAVLLGLTGIVILNLGNNFEFAFRLNGELLVLLSAVVIASANLMIKHFGKTHEPVALTGWQFILGGAILSGLGLAGGGSLIWPGFAKSLVLFYLMVLSALAYGIWSLLLKRYPVSKVVVFQSLTPVFGALFSWMILGEDIWRWQMLVALLVIAAGIMLLNLKKPATASVPQLSQTDE